MEALKNTSMMLILAAVFYGAYQMFVSDPNALQQADAKKGDGQEQVIHAGANSNAAGIPASLAKAHQEQAQVRANSGIGQSMTADSRQPQQGLPLALPPAGGSQLNHATAGISNPNPAIPNGPGLQSQLPTTPPSRNLPNSLPPLGNVAGMQLNNTQTAQSPMDGNIRFASNSEIAPHATNSQSANSQVGFNANVDRTSSSDLLPIQGQSNQSLGNNQASQRFAGSNNGANSFEGQNNAFAQQQQLKAELAADMQAAGAEIQSGMLGNALHRLSMWYDRPLADEDRNILISWLDNLAGDAIYSTKHALTNAYQVEQGDTLGSIARQFQVTPELLANINFYGQNVQADTPLQPGSQLKVVPGPLRAVAHLQRQELTVYVGALYAGRFSFRVGNSAPIQSSSHRITRVSTTGLPAADNVGQHAALSARNPFGRFCMVVGEDFVIHSPGNNPAGNCLEFQESDMQQLMVLLSQGCEVQVFAAE